MANDFGRGIVFSDSFNGAGFYIHPAVKKIILNVLFSIRLNQKNCASRVTGREGYYFQEIFVYFVVVTCLTMVIICILLVITLPILKMHIRNR